MTKKCIHLQLDCCAFINDLQSELKGADNDSHAESESAVWEDFRELWEDTERAPLFLSRGGSSVEQMSK